MKCHIILALLGASLVYSHQDEASRQRFREANRERIQKAILEMESHNGTLNDDDDGHRSDLAGLQRDPDDSIQRDVAIALEKKRQETIKKFLDKMRKISGTDDDKKGDFDYLMFTMIYPTATCRADDDQVPGSCAIPSGASQWTIHGLWPNYDDGTYPQFCDHRKFNESEVEDIHKEMAMKWPNLFPKSEEDSLWSHEWEKHGTCSSSDPLINSQFKYFNGSLSLLDTIDLRTKMEQKGISPRSAPYERDTLEASIESAVGKKVQMYCLQDKKSREWLLADIRVCLNRDLVLIDCPKAEITPFVRLGELTHEDHQPLPVPRRCGEEVYYISEGEEISNGIDVYHENDYDDESYGEKKMMKNEKKNSDEDSDYDDSSEEIDDKLIKNKMDDLRSLGLKKTDVTDSSDYARVAEEARKYQESRIVRRPNQYNLILGSICLILYLIIIITFVCGHRSDRQVYNRLQFA